MNDLKIEFLGSGSAFVLAKENYHSSILISKTVKGETKRFLFDAGTTIAESLNLAGYTPNDIDTVFISHLHADHAGGIEYIGFKRYFDTFRANKPRLVSYKNILTKGWESTWSGGMKCLSTHSATLDTYFNTVYLEEDDRFDFYGTTMQLVRTTHAYDGNRKIDSFGLIIFTEDCEPIFISGDTQLSDELFLYYDVSTLIFHDCELASYPDAVHAQYDKLKELPESFRKKMYLYHYSVKAGTELPDAVADGFLGFVKRGDCF